MLGCGKMGPDTGNWASCTAGLVTFMLRRCPDAIPASELGDYSYVAYLTVDAVDGHYSRALAEKAQVLKPPTSEPWGRREMALRTPDGPPHHARLADLCRARRQRAVPFPSEGPQH